MGYFDYFLSGFIKYDIFVGNFIKTLNYLTHNNPSLLQALAAIFQVFASIYLPYKLYKKRLYWDKQKSINSMKLWHITNYFNLKRIDTNLSIIKTDKLKDSIYKLDCLIDLQDSDENNLLKFGVKNEIKLISSYLSTIETFLDKDLIGTRIKLEDIKNNKPPSEASEIVNIIFFQNLELTIFSIEEIIHISTSIIPRIDATFIDKEAPKFDSLIHLLKSLCEHFEFITLAVQELVEEMNGKEPTSLEDRCPL